MKKINTIFALILISSALNAQSQDFKLGKWTEIQNAIIKELERSYVDSLQVDRIYRAGIDAMLDNIDPYTMYIPEEENEDLMMMVNKSYGGIGAIIHKKVGENVIINEPYKDSPAALAGLTCGDEIIAVDSVLTKPLTASESTDRMKGKPGTEVKFLVKKVRTADTVEVNITRKRIHLPDIEYFGMIDDTTGYILQTGFTQQVSRDVKNAVISLKEKGMKRLVLDLRGNGGGLLSEAVNIVGLFVPKGSLVVTSKRKDGLKDEEFRTTSEPIDTLLPVIVMVDGGSASASEIVSGALQDMDRGVVMGRRTYGKGLVQSIRPLPYNGQIKLTTAKYHTPSGRCVQAIDYARRGDDGSVQHIPDSLTNEFKTLKGRTVRDGGGITPDFDIPHKDYSRLVYSLVLGGVVDNYAMDFVRRNESIAPIGEFRFTDAMYDDFVAFAKTQEFDYRSGAKALYDQMKAELEADGLADTMAGELSALEKALEMDKERFIRLKKDEIIPFIEEEIAVRYYFQEAGVLVRLRYDEQLHKALKIDIN